MYRKIFAIIVIALTFFFGINYVFAEEENITEGEPTNVVVPTETQDNEGTDIQNPATDNNETTELPAEPEAEETPVRKVNVRIIDSRTGDVATTIELLADATSNTQVSLTDLFGMRSTLTIDEKLYTHKFIGFYDAATDGNQITNSYSNSTLYPNLEKITANSTQTSPANYKLTLRAKSDITADSTVDVYARFETTEKPNGKITINIIDSRTGDVVDSLITYATDGGTNSDNNKKLTDIFPKMSTSGSNVVDVLDGRKYIFKGFYTDAAGETQITKSFTPGETYPELRTLKVTADLTTSTWRNYRFQAISKTDNSVDNTYNVYAIFDEYPSTKLTIVFKELSESGTELNDTQNEVQRSTTNIIDLGNSQTQKSVKLKVTEFISGNYKYVVDGWYEEDGVTPVPTSMYVNGDPLQISVSYKCTADSPKELTLTYILKWKEYLNPVYKFNVVDEVSNGDHHWDNTDGHFGEYTYTFKKPAEKEHYKFLYYKMDDVTKNAGEKYNHDITAQGYGTEVEETFNAWWKADVTLILLDGSNELGRGSDFESISVSDILENNPEKIGYRFLGWTDAEGNDITTLTYEADEESTNPTPKEVKLYAKWEQIMIDITVKKEWNDNNNNDNVRPDSVTVNLKNGNETVDTVVLNENNKWTHTFNVPEYDEVAKIEYTVEENSVKGYTAEINGTIEEGFVITNTHADDTKDITVTKVWDDKDNYNNKRPETVMIVLLANGEEVNSTLLSESNNWTYTFEKLNVNEQGTAIEYTVKEVEVEDYWTEVEGSAEDGFTITNTYFGEGGNDDPIPEPEPTPSSNPKTADNIMNYLLMLMVSLFGIIKTYAILLKK